MTDTPKYRFKTCDWSYGDLSVDEVAERIAVDDPEFEAHREHLEALAIRVMELKAMLSESTPPMRDTESAAIEAFTDSGHSEHHDIAFDDGFHKGVAWAEDTR